MTAGQLAGRLVPGPAGRLAIKYLVRLQPQHERWLLQAGRHFTPARPIHFRTAAGFQMELHLDDKIERRIYYTGMYERVLDTILEHALNRAPAFVDVGANCGYVSLFAATMLGDRGRVYSFEPFPATFRRLERNLELNSQLTNIVPYRVALTDSPGMLKLHARSGNLGSTSMAAASEGSDAVEVGCDTLDRVASARDLTGAFVKVDVEGAELHVLRGMASLLAGRAPANVLVEMHPAQIRELGGQPGEVPRLLESFGYRLLTNSGRSLVAFNYEDFFSSDLGHRFILATLEDHWTGLELPSGF